MNVAISPESERQLRALVADRIYPDESQAVEAAIHLLYTRRMQVEEVREKLAVAAEDIRAGRVHEIDPDELLADLTSRIAAHA